MAVAGSLAGSPSQVTPQRLNNSVALPLMQQTETLGKAYICFEEVNALNVRLHGGLLPEAVYNQACCLSLGTSAILRSPTSASPGLPPLATNMPLSELVERRLDLVHEKLSAAIHAGYSNGIHLQTDPDLQAFREHRATQFLAVLGQLGARGE